MEPDSTVNQDSITVRLFREVSIGLDILEACVDQRYRIAWDFSSLDSLSQPDTLLLKGYRYDEGETEKSFYRSVGFDSADLHENGEYWLVSPGYYWLEGYDSSRMIHFTSNEIRIDLCALFQLPEQFVLNSGKSLQPVYSQNIDKIELVIFNSQGDEVYFTKDPHFKWDGRNTKSGSPCGPGSYFYHCDIWERKGDRIEKRNITGIIEFTF